MIHKPNPQKELLQRKKQFAREHGRNYKSGAEVHLRREIFNENYKSMMEHNARSAGQLHPILFLLLVILHFPAFFSSFLWSTFPTWVSEGEIYYFFHQHSRLALEIRESSILDSDKVVYSKKKVGHSSKNKNSSLLIRTWLSI